MRFPTAELRRLRNAKKLTRRQVAALMGVARYDLAD
ncbi:transcriptional regulator with XRE-family HTH domain [Kibdelosporangium phytohabitans]|nr:transcriptional regulator with XRE-family HTH domain [Kibdelosporangium phytohabitans]